MLSLGIFARLFFSSQRMFIFRFCFQNDKRKPLFIEQEEINKAVFACLEIFPKRIDMAFSYLDIILEDNICLAFGIVKKLPACFFEQFIDFDSSFGFFAHGFLSRVMPR